MCVSRLESEYLVHQSPTPVLCDTLRSLQIWVCSRLSLNASALDGLGGSWLLTFIPCHPHPHRPFTRFHVNLLCDQEGAEAALHFNPRLDESVVVFNTKEQGAWGKEERGRGLPFQRGQPFEVLLIATEEGFKVRLCRRGAGRQDPGPCRGWGRPARPWVEVWSKGVAKAGRGVLIPVPLREPPQ